MTLTNWVGQSAVAEARPIPTSLPLPTFPLGCSTLFVPTTEESPARYPLTALLRPAAGTQVEITRVAGDVPLVAVQSAPSVTTLRPLPLVLPPPPPSPY